MPVIPDLKISALTNYTNPDPANDVIPIVDTANSATKKITRNNFLGITSAPVGINDTQTLTAKTLTASVINSPVLGGTLTGTYTLAGSPTFPASVVQLTGTQTITGVKTFTNVILTAPTITNASITADAITGFTTSNSGTIYGVSITAGTISGSSLSPGTVGSTALATNAVQGNQIATNAIKLGTASITANISTQATSATQAVGLTSTVIVPAGSRSVKVTVSGGYLAVGTGSKNIYLTLWRGTVGSGTQLGLTQCTQLTANFATPMMLVALDTPSVGSTTYNVGYATDAGPVTLTWNVSSAGPAILLVEAI